MVQGRRLGVGRRYGNKIKKWRTTSGKLCSAWIRNGCLKNTKQYKGRDGNTEKPFSPQRRRRPTRLIGVWLERLLHWKPNDSDLKRGVSADHTKMRLNWLGRTSTDNQGWRIWEIDSYHGNASTKSVTSWLIGNSPATNLHAKAFALKFYRGIIRSFFWCKHFVRICFVFWGRHSKLMYSLRLGAVLCQCHPFVVFCAST